MISNKLLDHIIDTTAMVYGVTEQELASPCRKQHLVYARNMVTDIAYSEFLYTYAFIGKRLNRTHGTLIKNLESFAQDCRTKPQLKAIRAMIHLSAKEFLQKQLQVVHLQAGAASAVGDPTIIGYP